MANNYNMSSTGYSVEVTAFYDTDLSQCYFNENFISEKNERSLMYTGGEHSADDFIITVNDREKLLDYMGWDEDDAEGYSNDDLFNEAFYNQTIDYKLTKLTSAGVEYDCNFEVMISTGYSQGDRRAVYILKTDTYVTREHIDHLLWDSPISARIEINGDEVLVEDDILGDDWYRWDKNDVIKRVTAALIKQNYPAECIEEVTALIPQNLSYE